MWNFFHFWRKIWHPSNKFSLELSQCFKKSVKTSDAHHWNLFNRFDYYASLVLYRPDFVKSVFFVKKILRVRNKDSSNSNSNDLSWFWTMEIGGKWSDKLVLSKYLLNISEIFRYLIFWVTARVKSRCSLIPLTYCSL